MRKALLTTLSISALAAFGSAQYVGEAPFVTKCEMDINSKGLTLKATDFAGASRVSQIHAVNTKDSHIVYVTTTSRMGTDQPWAGYVNLITRAVTATDDMAPMDNYQATRGEFQATTDNWIVDASAEGGGHPTVCAMDVAGALPAIWGKWDSSKGKGGQFIPQGAIKNIPSGYIDIQFETIGGKLKAMWIDGNGNIVGGDFAAGTVTGVQQYMIPNGPQVGAGIHSHTGYRSSGLNAESYAFNVSNRNNSSDNAFCAKGADAIWTQVGKQNYFDTLNTTWMTNAGNPCDTHASWLNNGMTVGGTTWLASSQGSYNNLAETEIFAMSAEYVNTKNGAAKATAHVWAPWREKGLPLSVSVIIASQLGKGPIKVGTFGNIGFDVGAAWVILPGAMLIQPQDGYGNISFNVPVGTPQATLIMQPVGLDLQNNRAFIGNTAEFFNDKK